MDFSIQQSNHICLVRTRNRSRFPDTKYGSISPGLRELAYADFSPPAGGSKGILFVTPGRLLNLCPVQ